MRHERSAFPAWRKFAGFYSRRGFARPARLLVWQLLVSVLLVFLGAVALGLPPWSLGIVEIGWLGQMYAAYLVSTLPASTRFLKQRELSLPATFVLTAAIFLGAWLATPVVDSGWVVAWPFVAGQKDMAWPNWPFPAGLLLLSAGFAILANGMMTRPERVRRRALLVFSVSLTVLAVCSTPAIRGAWIYRALQHPVAYEMNASFHRLRIRYFRDRLPQTSVHGGALAVLDDELLLMAGDGWLYRVRISSDSERMEVHPLNQRVPLNSAAYVEASPRMSAFQRRIFRAIDLLIIDGQGAGEKRLLASHHYFDARKSCYTVRVSELMMAWNDVISGSPAGGWNTVHEARPCLPLSPNGEFRIAGHQTGGALLHMGQSKVLMALGDGGFDGVQFPRAVSQDMQSEFGKIIELDLSTGVARIVTSGHRSPGGLHLDTFGRLWLTEHGPRGGDELNRIRFGRDYGWPRQTLGSQYGMLVWPGQDEAGMKGDFEAPAFAWSPSIATSALTSLRGPAFEHWQGDLIVSSLADRAVHRVHLIGDTPVLAERVPVYERVRDIVQDHQGRIVFWTDRGVIGLIEAVR